MFGRRTTDCTEGITRVDDLLRPLVARRSRDYRRRALHDLGNLRLDRPVDLHVVYSRHHSRHCRLWLSADLSDFAPPSSRSSPTSLRP